MKPEEISVFAIGGKNEAFAKYFVGQSYLNMLTTDGVVIGNVTFEPGCRNNWHIHHAKSGGGQILLVTGGRGYYQEWGKEPRELRPGDVVNIPAGVKHWHGAAPDRWFSHLAIEVPGEETQNEWCEPVSDEEYSSLKQDGIKSIVIYYSYGGNTRKIAEEIQKRLGADAAEIETAKPYIGSYNDVVDQGQQEVNSGFMPEIKPLMVDLSQYDTVILGTPVWWYTFAPAMKTFLNSVDLSGKNVYPFATNGGWIGHTFEDFEKMCPGARIQSGLNVRFDEDEQITAEEDINRWIQNIGEKYQRNIRK